ncbi:MAG: putative PEP-binding protein [Candidatus Nanopelagicales bacterium]
MILAESDEERDDALAALLPLQRKDFIRILEAMDGLPVTIRLLDPPLHEFLPDLTELSRAGGRGRGAGQAQRRPICGCCGPCDRLHEANPMLGLRGVRLGLVVPKASSHCRCGRSPKPRASGSGWAATRTQRS